MPEKMYGFTHLISESKLLSLIATHADEVKVDIFTPERRGTRKLQNGNAPPLLIEAPSRKAPPQQSPHPAASQELAHRWGMNKWGAKQLILKLTHDNADRPVLNQEFIAEGKNHGITAGAISVAASYLIKEGFIERTGVGAYKILREGIKHVDAILGGAVATKPRQGVRGRVNSVALIGKALATAGEPVEAIRLREMFKASGLDPNSVSARFNGLMKAGFAKQVSRGVYQITPKGMSKYGRAPSP